MQSISEYKHKNKLLIALTISILLFLFSLSRYINITNTLSLYNVEKEIVSVFGEGYKIEISNIADNQFVIDIMSDKDNIDQTEKVELFKTNLSNYKSDLDDINRIVLRTGTYDIDTKYIDSTTDIDLSQIK